MLAEMARNHVDRPMLVTVYNGREDTTREVSITPSENWGGRGLLGASIRFAQYTGAIDRVWHVLDITYESPAHRAGLIPAKGTQNIGRH